MKTRYFYMMFVMALASWGAVTLRAQDLLRHPPLHKILVWVQGSDADISTRLEFQLLEGLADHQVAGKRFSEEFPPGVKISNAKKVRQLKDEGYDALLFVERGSTIHWDTKRTDAGAPRLSPLRTLLKKNVPRDGGFDVELDSPAVQTIEVNNGFGTWDIVKGRALLFAIPQGALLWSGRAELKSPQGLPTSHYIKDIAHLILDDLVSTGFLSSLKH